MIVPQSTQTDSLANARPNFARKERGATSLPKAPRQRIKTPSSRHTMMPSRLNRCGRQNDRLSLILLRSLQQRVEPRDRTIPGSMTAKLKRKHHVDLETLYANIPNAKSAQIAIDSHPTSMPTNTVESQVCQFSRRCKRAESFSLQHP